MAVNPFDPSHLGADPFDIYNDNAAVAARTSLFQLPTGACNFVDLTPGANGSRCGCRRFWSRQSLGTPVTDQSGWCMCNHHACYHDDGSHQQQEQQEQQQQQQQQQQVEAFAAGQENEKPRTGREPLSPVLEMVAKEAPAILGPEFQSFGGATQLSFLHKSFDAAYNLGAVASSQPGASMPDTLAWADLIQSQPDAITLPPIPPQCLMSQTASTTSSVHARYLRPFSGKGLQTLDTGSNGAKQPSLSQQKSRSRNLQLAPSLLQQKDSSADESFVLVTADEGTFPRPGTATTQIEPRASEAMPREALKNITDTVSAHGQRLDRLEAVSFSAAAHDECLEKHDQLDLRVAELESRVEEVEKMALDHDAAANIHAPSVVSVDSSATSRPSQSQEIYSQLQSLQAQVSQLQSVMPSYNHAWEVEVVFLPFALKKVWQYIHQFKTDLSASNADDWTQLPMTHSASAMHPQSPFLGDWATPDHDVEWLLPRACGDKSVTDKRLRSRGLVKKLSVKGPDARSVHFAMNAAFGNVLREMHMRTRPQGSDPRLSRFMGLQSTWVPLRKIHKDSRLRFLGPDEMLTPALWNVQFLDSVMMRSSEPRLFVTHPDAYLQDYQAYEIGWTWQKLREMTRVYPDVTESQEVPEADALEDCWAWNEQLDETPGAQTSGSHRQEGRRVSISPSLAHFPTLQSWRSASPVVARGQSPVIKGRKDSWPFHVRAPSVPITTPAHPSPTIANPRRRVASLEHGRRRSSPGIPITASQAGIMKRRRTRSPSHARFTPRWTKSPSPMPLGLHERQTSARGTTPFAYATPYSNAPLQEMRLVRGSSVLRNELEYLGQGDDDDDDDDDDGFDVQIYESDSDESCGDAEEEEDDSNDDDDDDDDDEDDEVEEGARMAVDHAPRSDHQQQQKKEDSQSWQLPEDEPWPGIEDQDHHHPGSDGENIDPHQMEHDNSDASSQPSEYPATQRAWPGEGEGEEEADSSMGGFHIHEDDE